MWHSFLFAYHLMHNHGIILMHASHSCIIVIEPLENETIEPTKSVEPELVVEFVVEPEENQGKQLSMIPLTHSI